MESHIVSAPLKEIQKRLSEGIAGGSDPRKCGADWGLKDYLKQCLLNGDNGCSVPEIPLLDFNSFHSGKFQNHSLVRYRGFVQDMFEPEYFISAYQNRPDSEFVNVSFADVVVDEDPSQMGEEVENHIEAVKERLPLFCMPRRLGKKWNNIQGSTSTCSGDSQTVSSAEKRSSDVHDNNQVTVSSDKQMNDEETLENSSKKQNNTATTATDMCEDEEDADVVKPDVSFQAYCNQKDDLCCLVKMYDQIDTEGTVKLNEVYEFIGVIDAHPNNGTRVLLAYMPGVLVLFNILCIVSPCYL